jgi:hypothetical protein
MTALPGMDKLLFWLVSERRKRALDRKKSSPVHWVVSLVVGPLIAVLIGVGAFLLLVSQQ